MFYSYFKTKLPAAFNLKQTETMLIDYKNVRIFTMRTETNQQSFQRRSSVRVISSCPPPADGTQDRRRRGACTRPAAGSAT